MKPELFTTELEQLHFNAIIQWKQNPQLRTQSDFLKIAEDNHAFNFQLWHAEDRARRDDMGFEFVYLAKREIDHCNQQRNNCMEMMDEWLYQQLQPENPEKCPTHSETPGMMIDRLSILALKQYHMALQTSRSDVNEEHRERCLSKLQVITLQQRQLLQCLSEFLQQLIDKKRTFKIYHQFKMYNDPALNPELYNPEGGDVSS